MVKSLAVVAVLLSAPPLLAGEAGDAPTDAGSIDAEPIDAEPIDAVSGDVNTDTTPTLPEPGEDEPETAPEQTGPPDATPDHVRSEAPPRALPEEAPPTQTPDDENDPDDDTIFERSGAVGAGLAYFAMSNTGGMQVTEHLGAALHVRGQLRLWGLLGFNALFSWGLTEWQRTYDVGKAAIDAGEWTTTAFEDVSSWVGEDDGEYALLKIIPAIFAYVFLAVSYLAVPIALFAAPFAASTFMSTSLTTSLHLGNDVIHGFVEVGFTALAYIHPVHHDLQGGGGPTVGAGVKLGPVGLGARFTWSPPELHGEIPGERSDILMTSATVDYYF